MTAASIIWALPTATPVDEGALGGGAPSSHPSPSTAAERLQALLRSAQRPHAADGLECPV